MRGVDTVSELAKLTADLVAIDSVNPRLVSGGGGEREIARTVAEWLERAGLEVSVEETPVGRPNVIGRSPAVRSGPTLLFLAHTDTVGTAGMERPFRGYQQFCSARREAGPTQAWSGSTSPPSSTYAMS